MREYLHHTFLITLLTNPHKLHYPPQNQSTPGGCFLVELCEQVSLLVLFLANEAYFSLILY